VSGRDWCARVSFSDGATVDMFGYVIGAMLRWLFMCCCVGWVHVGVLLVWVSVMMFGRIDLGSRRGDVRLWHAMNIAGDGRGTFVVFEGWVVV
jgi:hypothetical protein